MKIKDIENGILEEEFDDNLLLEVTAYHGSAYNFDKFDVAFIGKGEHGQAHGWGLYFSFGKGVAQGYRSRISSMNTGNQFQVYTYKGKSYEAGTIMYSVLNMLANYGKKESIEKIDKILADTDYMTKHPNVKPYLEQAKKDFKSLKTGDLKVKPLYEEGNFYTVNLPEFDYYLVEEDSFNEQSDYVQKCIKKLNTKNPNLKSVKEFMGYNDYYARRFYNALEREVGSPKKASLLLNEYGIAGIRYEGNIDKGCAVLFNNNDITLVSKATLVDKNEPKLPDLMMIEENPDFIAQINNPSFELQMAAVKAKLSTLKFINNPDIRVVKYVLNDDPNLISYVNNPSRELIDEYFDKISNHTLIELIEHIKDESLRKEYIMRAMDEDIGFLKLYCISKSIYNDKNILKDILEHINEKNEAITIANVLNSFSKKLPFDIVEIFQDVFYNGSHYSKLNEGDKSLNYCVTSVYFFDGDLNTAPKEIRERCLSWNWYHAIEELREFTEDDLKVFKLNYKLGYLEQGGSWTTFELHDCKISDEVIKELISFIKEIKKKGIVIGYRDLVRYMDIEELYNICADNSKVLRDTIDNLRNYSAKVKGHELFLYIFEHKIKSMKDFNSDYCKTLLLDNVDGLMALKSNNPEAFKKNDLLLMALIRISNMRGYRINRDLLSDADVNIQKYIISQNVELLKYVNNVDKNIQMNLVKRNPFYIKYINNPDKNVIEIATKEEPMIVDYIRN